MNRVWSECMWMGNPGYETCENALAILKICSHRTSSKYLIENAIHYGRHTFRIVRIPARRVAPASMLRLIKWVWHRVL